MQKELEDIVALKSNELIWIGYSKEEQAIYVKEAPNVIRVFEEKSREVFDQFKNSKQQDYFYFHVLRRQQHKIIV